MMQGMVIATRSCKRNRLLQRRSFRLTLGSNIQPHACNAIQQLVTIFGHLLIGEPTNEVDSHGYVNVTTYQRPMQILH